VNIYCLTSSLVEDESAPEQTDQPPAAQQIDTDGAEKHLDGSPTHLDQATPNPLTTSYDTLSIDRSGFGAVSLQFCSDS
jgi:hypothetical protein